MLLRTKRSVAHGRAQTASHVVAALRGTTGTSQPLTLISRTCAQILDPQSQIQSLFKNEMAFDICEPK